MCLDLPTLALALFMAFLLGVSRTTIQRTARDIRRRVRAARRAAQPVSKPRRRRRRAAPKVSSQ